MGSYSYVLVVTVPGYTGEVRYSITKAVGQAPQWAGTGPRPSGRWQPPIPWFQFSGTVQPEAGATFFWDVWARCMTAGGLVLGTTAVGATGLIMSPVAYFYNWKLALPTPFG